MADAAVILAGGSGTRVGAGENKVYLPLAGRSMISWSVRAFAAAGIARIVVVARPDQLDLARGILRREVAISVEVIAGGETRHASEYAALNHLAADIESAELELLGIHDGARPLVSVDLIRSVYAAAVHGGALPGIPVTDLATLSATGCVPIGASVRTVRVQTPQIFRAVVLLAAYRKAELDGFAGSDTAATVERFGESAITCVPGDVLNVKVTFPQDLLVAERVLRERHGSP